MMSHLEDNMESELYFPSPLNKNHPQLMTPCLEDDLWSEVVDELVSLAAEFHVMFLLLPLNERNILRSLLGRHT